MSAKIAIVGAGPSGCYTAQALLKRAPDAQVDVIDAQPVPYGLVRYGVAADHQGTKGVARQFERVFTRQGARFLGNLRIGIDVSIDDLRAAYDAVVIAAGLSRDRPLGIPGEDLPEIVGAGCLTRALNEHPDAVPLPHLGETPLVIGTGNVAMDVIRLLAKTPKELQGSDLGAGPTAWLAAKPVRKITVVGRSPAASATFSPVMMKELAELERTDLRLRYGSAEGAEALAAGVAAEGGDLPVDFCFGCRPVSLTRTATGYHLSMETPKGLAGIEASGIITAIGFTATPGLDRAAILAAVEAPQGPSGRLYAAGWFAGGPVGAIPQCRAAGQALAERILAEVTPDPDRPGGARLAARGTVVDFAHWQQIDALELARAPEGRCRAKLYRREDLLRPDTLTDTLSDAPLQDAPFSGRMTP